MLRESGSALAAAASQETVMLQTQVVSLLPSRGWEVQGQDARKVVFIRSPLLLACRQLSSHSEST